MMALAQLTAAGLAVWAAGGFLLASHLLGLDGQAWLDAGRRITAPLDALGVFWIGAAVGALRIPGVVTLQSSLLVIAFAAIATGLVVLTFRRRRPAT